MPNILPIYKPKGPTSHDVMDKLRKITGIKKIGHAGTLDPLARGVLVVGIGREATRELSNVVSKEKEYLAKVKLGIESTTDDEEGEKEEIGVSEIPSLEEVKKVVSDFQGQILQTPPVYSAVKIKGREAYKLARQGKEPKLEPREVEIKKIEILKYQWPELKLLIVTGPGVYIRAMARDIGKKLRTGGYLSDLERVRVGDFTKEKAMTLEEFKNFWLG